MYPALICIETLVALWFFSAAIAMALRNRQRRRGQTEQTFWGRLIIGASAMMPALLLAGLVWWAIWMVNLSIGGPILFIAVSLVGSLGIGLAVLTGRSWRPMRALIAGVSLLGLVVITLFQADQAVRWRYQAAVARSQAACIALLPGTPPPQDNAALDYPALERDLRQLRKMFDFEAEPTAIALILWWKGGKKINTLPILSPALTQAFDLILARIHRTAGKPFFSPIHDWSRPPYEMQINEIGITRELVQVLEMQAQRQLQADHLEDAWRQILAMNRISEHIQSTPILVCQLISTTEVERCFTLANKLSLRGISSLPNPDKCTLGEPWTESLRRSFIADQAASLHCLVEDFDVSRFATSLDTSSPQMIYFATIVYRIFKLDQDSQRLEELRHSMREVLRVHGFQALKDDDYKPKWDGCFPHWYGNLAVRWEICATHIIKADAQRRIIYAALQAAAYRRAHGTWPTAFDDDWPSDPFLEPGKREKTDDPLSLLTPPRLRTRLDGDRLLIWSVGPDGIDDQGQPYDQKTQKGDIVLTLAP